MTETRKQVALLRAALNNLRDLTGGTHSQDEAEAFGDAWAAMCMLERRHPPMPVAVAGAS